MINVMMQIRKKAQSEELDYTFIMDCLKGYKSPRAKLTGLLKNGNLIRIKKGLYLFGYDYRKEPYSQEVMANKIYGPSYVSLEYALSYYGMIPEHVEEITSVSTKRTRIFNTPVGRFSYKHIPVALYRVGFNLVSVRDNATALIATPEKALADLLYLRRVHPETLDELSTLLFEDLRLDYALIRRMRIGIFRDILKAGGVSSLKLLIEWLRGQK
jgi:predicted transcriptional regulator of viral defense system